MKWLFTRWQTRQNAVLKRSKQLFKIVCAIKCNLRAEWLAVFCKNRDQKINWRVGEWVCKISTLYFSVENKLHKNAKCLALSVSSVMKPCWMKNTHQSGRIINRMVLNVLFSRKIRCLSELKGKLLEKHLEKDLKMNYRIFLTSTHGDGVLLGCQVCWNLQTVKVRVVDIIALTASAYL